jgi:hypothetical protein
MEIYDIVGEEIRVGSLIAFPKGNQGELEVGIVVGISDGTINYLIKSRKSLYDKPTDDQLRKYRRGQSYSYGPRRRHRRKPRGKFLGYSEWFAKKSWINIKSGESIQNRIVVIKNPLYHLNNPSISEQLEIMDLGKDKEFLPANYHLGKPDSIVDDNEDNGDVDAE